MSNSWINCKWWLFPLHVVVIILWWKSSSTLYRAIHSQIYEAIHIVYIIIVVIIIDAFTIVSHPHLTNSWCSIIIWALLQWKKRGGSLTTTTVIWQGVRLLIRGVYNTNTSSLFSWLMSCSIGLCLNSRYCLIKPRIYFRVGWVLRRGCATTLLVLQLQLCVGTLISNGLSLFIICNRIIIIVHAGIIWLCCDSSWTKIIRRHWSHHWVITN